ncbi:alpha/beta fold hydrolase [Amycolatopsis sp. GM8]|uniref:alpha/beta fold hydrolase n=1 Tax=Amycolatopsis sp. GM8 TaxID=2896530 RepID=UPI001F329D51|nr:alpha/beta fold hydrolase [Amycolatopsis sp. GM8]
MLLPADEAGRGPVIVLLHARPTDRTMWTVHLPLFAAAGFRVIAPDLPGYGAAIAHGRGELTPWTDVLETLDHLGAERFVLAGNSLGALVALNVAVLAPDRVEGLVLVGYRRHDQEPSARLRKAWDDEQTALARGDLDAAVRAGVEAWTSADAAPEVKAHADRMLREQLTSRLTHGETPLAAAPLDETPGALGTLAGPALVGVGGHDLPDFFRGGEELAGELGAGELVVIPGAGHLAPLEQPAAFVGLVRDFVASSR